MCPNKSWSMGGFDEYSIDMFYIGKESTDKLHAYLQSPDEEQDKLKQAISSLSDVLSMCQQISERFRTHYTRNPDTGIVTVTYTDNEYDTLAINMSDSEYMLNSIIGSLDNYKVFNECRQKEVKVDTFEEDDIKEFDIDLNNPSTTVLEEIKCKIKDYFGSVAEFRHKYCADEYFYPEGAIGIVE